MNPEKINLIRHFDDVDNLRLYDRDAILMPDQEYKAEAIAEELYTEIKRDGEKAVMFITSPRIRAKDSAKMIADSLLRIDNSLKVRFSVNDDLRVIDQGSFIIPEDYKEGDKYEGLILAGKAFSKETHGSDSTGGVDNYNYRFGDPVLLADGTFKYPELSNFFERYGETYKELLIRIYRLVIKTYEKLDKMNGGTKLVVITHGQPSQIFKDLKKAAQMIKNKEIKYTEGELAKLCWEIYKKRDNSEKVTGRLDTLSLDELSDPDMIDLLKKEINYLEKYE
ncbi:MAG: hypothetical protein NTV72_01015 [Candidatus Taylorbacteria bacterium]|nr:hypothetical protein [Candidatus Taylorbacteria bacterium]